MAKDFAINRPYAIDTPVGRAPDIRIPERALPVRITNLLIQLTIIASTENAKAVISAHLPNTTNALAMLASEFNSA